MELISKLLFWVANSLLIPDIIILLCLFVRSLILIGGTYNMYMTKRKNDKALDQLIKDARIDDLKAALPDKDYIWVISAICSTIRPVQITLTS